MSSNLNQLFGMIVNPRFTDADYIGPVDMRGMVVDKEVMYRKMYFLEIA